ncbi:hypothetical protein BK133_28715, partial [Paenibacillus sp. FSL H8-0548]
STTALDLRFAQLHQGLLANFRLRKLSYIDLNFRPIPINSVHKTKIDLVNRPISVYPIKMRVIYGFEMK